MKEKKKHQRAFQREARVLIWEILFQLLIEREVYMCILGCVIKYVS